MQVFSFLAWAKLGAWRTIHSYFPVIRKAGASLVTEDARFQSYSPDTVSLQVPEPFVNTRVSLVLSLGPPIPRWYAPDEGSREPGMFSQPRWVTAG